MKKVLIFGGGFIGNSLKQKFKNIGSEVVYIQHEEMKTYESIASIFKSLEKNCQYTVIVTAGFLEKKLFVEMKEEDIIKTINSNLLTVVYVFQNALKFLNSPKLFCISSSVYKGREGYSIYSSAKIGLYSLVNSLRMEHPDIYVGCIFPGRTSTPLRWKNYGKCLDKEEDVMSPDDVAEQIIRQIQEKDESFYEIRKIKNEIILKKVGCE